VLAISQEVCALAQTHSRALDGGALAGRTVSERSALRSCCTIGFFSDRDSGRSHRCQAGHRQLRSNDHARFIIHDGESARSMSDDARFVEAQRQHGCGASATSAQRIEDIEKRYMPQHLLELSSLPLDGYWRCSIVSRHEENGRGSG